MADQIRSRLDCLIFANVKERKKETGKKHISLLYIKNLKDTKFGFSFAEIPYILAV